MHELWAEVEPAVQVTLAFQVGPAIPEALVSVESAELALVGGAALASGSVADLHRHH